MNKLRDQLKQNPKKNRILIKINIFLTYILRLCLVEENFEGKYK